MKKISAMLLSLTMCFSLLAIPAKAAFIPAPGDSGIVDAGELKKHETPGKTGDSIQWPEERDRIPTD